mmetsp:Transcript_366/g.726  ORF Transcript_366/g.726 Transcript_366/m.726 type:complete len:153 (-) Transcript_366:409-867(-)
MTKDQEVDPKLKHIVDTSTRNPSKDLNVRAALKARASLNSRTRRTTATLPTLDAKGVKTNTSKEVMTTIILSMRLKLEKKYCRRKAISCNSNSTKKIVVKVYSEMDRIISAFGHAPGCARPRETFAAFPNHCNCTSMVMVFATTQQLMMCDM